MILALLILLLMATGLLAWLAGRWNDSLSRFISLAGTLAYLVVVLSLWWGHYTGQAGYTRVIGYTRTWIPALGIRIDLAADGLSLLMLLLTAFLGVLSVLVSWKEIRQRVGFFTSTCCSSSPASPVSSSPWIFSFSTSPGKSC